MINTQAQWEKVHSWIILVIVIQHLVQTGRIDGPTEYVSYILAAIRSVDHSHYAPAHTPVPRARQGASPPRPPAQCEPPTSVSSSRHAWPGISGFLPLYTIQYCHLALALPLYTDQYCQHPTTVQYPVPSIPNHCTLSSTACVKPRSPYNITLACRQRILC